MGRVQQVAWVLSSGMAVISAPGCIIQKWKFMCVLALNSDLITTLFFSVYLVCYLQSVPQSVTLLFPIIDCMNVKGRLGVTQITQKGWLSVLHNTAYHYSYHQR